MKNNTTIPLKKFFKNQKLGFFIAIIASSVILWFAVRDVELKKTIDALGQTKLVFVVFAVMMKLSLYLLMSLRWRLLFSKKSPPLYHLLSYITVGILPNTFFNTGPLPRLFLLQRFSGTNYSDGFAIIMIEKITDAFALAVLLLLSVYFFQLGTWIPYSSSIELIFIIVLFVTILVFTLPHKVVLIINYTKNKYLFRFPRINIYLESIKNVLMVLKQKKKLFPVLVLSFLIILFPAGIVYLIMEALHIQGSMSTAFLLMTALLIGSRIPSVGGIGAFQYICILVLSEISVGTTVAFAFSIVLLFVLRIPPLILGALLLPSLGKNARCYNNAQDTLT